jgi:hypothetical protein
MPLMAKYKSILRHNMHFKLFMAKYIRSDDIRSASRKKSKLLIAVFENL